MPGQRVRPILAGRATLRGTSADDDTS